MRPPHVRRRPTVPRPAALLALGVLACSDGPLGGPGLPGRGASLRLEPRVEPRASVVAAGISRVRVAIARVPDGLTVLDSVVDLVGAHGAELDLAVPLASSSDRFVVRLAAADAAGDTIFRAADTTEVVRGSATPSLELLLRYAGPDTAVARIVAGPDTAVLDAGGVAPLWVVGYRAGSDDPTPLAHVSWRSGDETVVRVSRTGGHVTAIAPGRAAWVYATTVTGLVDSARVVVRHVLATLEPSPAALALAPGGAAQVAVAGRSADGGALPAQAVTWSSSDTTVAVVDASGRVFGVAVGGATITATSGGAQAAVPVVVALQPVVEVRLAPQAVSLVRLERAQLVATPRLADGTVARDQAPTWTTSDASVATVGAGGVVTGVGVGVATVTATIGGRTASAEVEVSPLPAGAVIASPETVQLVTGESLLLSATATDAAGEPVPNTPVLWTSSSPEVVLVSSAGQLTAVAPGTATVTASANGRASTVAVTVLPPPVASVLLSRTTRVQLVAGTAVDLDATPRAADGTPLPDRSVAWSTSAAAVATVSADGRVVAVAPGTAYVTATSEGVAGTVRVDVVPVPVASVTLPASSLVLALGGTFQLRADAHDSLGHLLPGRVATWSSSDASVASVATDGLVSARTVGTAVVTATVEGRTATATVLVAAPTLPAVQFSPSGAQYALGQTMAAQTVGISYGVGTTSVQLTSADGAIARVQQTATVVGAAPAPFTVTGLALGTVRLQGASSGAATGVTDATVVPATLRAVGWTGTVVAKDDYIRIRLEAGGTDGTSQNAVFAHATPLVLWFHKDTIEVHRDEFPDSAVGPVPSGHKDGQLSPGETIQPKIGARHFTLIIRARRVAPGWLTISSANRYQRLELRNLTIVP